MYFVCFEVWGFSKKYPNKKSKVKIKFLKLVSKIPLFSRVRYLRRRINGFNFYGAVWHKLLKCFLKFNSSSTVMPNSTITAQKMKFSIKDFFSNHWRNRKTSFFVQCISSFSLIFMKLIFKICLSHFFLPIIVNWNFLD